MAEPFGIAAGTVGVAAAFTACIDCFEYVQFGRNFGRDFQTDLLALNCAKLRLSRWGEAVKIYDDPNLGKRDASLAEIQVAKDTFYQILVLFSNTQKISEKHKMKARDREDLSVFAPCDIDPTVTALADNMRALVIRRQKGSSVLKTASWALYHRSEFKRLIEDIVSLISNLEKIFPEPQLQLIADEEAAQVHDKSSLKLLETAARDVDPLLETATKKGHKYSNFVVKGKAHTGDAFHGDWHGNANGASHIYDGVEVGENGKVLVGNKYGGKDFWDD
ncbi:hypothetical protein McanMca71_004776 [Microsporum canis]|uniref:Small s protein n=1 Tax=Arthroderma otae (strain ATCC MYA-4605 / CBS 113480) TaxID=554155 RepID=C5FZQ2_ARTOC|nr:small s protein [Microsporum canis CBS 113480]EEQ35355.1 small s protein [Microsporum canis CBS 113480]